MGLARRRSFWTIGDQVVSSAQSFAVSLVVTHSLAAPLTVGGGVVGAIHGPGPAMAGIAAGELLCALLTTLAYRSVWRSWKSEPWGVAPLPLATVDSRATA